MIAMTLGELVAAEPALTRIAEMRLPVKTAYHLAKLLRLVREETAHFQTERTNLIKQHGEERDASPTEQAATGALRLHYVPPAKAVEFSGAMQALADVPAEIAWAPLTLAELGEVQLAGADLCLLGALLADPEQKEA